MLKKQQKWIAVLVTVTFAWLLQASALPLAASGETGQPSAATVDQAGDPGVEQAPGFFEQQGPDWNRRVKTKTVLIIIGAFLIISIIFALIKGVGAAPHEGMSASNMAPSS